MVARTATAPAVATPPVPATTGYGDSFLRTAWTLTTPGVTDCSLSPDGKSVAWTDADGRVRRVNAATSRTLWRTAPLAGVNCVVAGSDGVVAAYSGLNPEHNSLLLLDGVTGDKKTRVFAGDGAVWSAAFAGQTAFVGTGGRAVYAVGTVPQDTPRYRTEGIPDDFAVSADGSRLAFGTWSPPSVSGCEANGAGACWRFKDKPGRREAVSVSANGTRVMVLSTLGASGEQGVIRVHDAGTGKIVWQVALPSDAAKPVALLAADGDSVAVSYCRTGKTDVPDWRLAYFNGAGQRFFADKGSALFQPHLVAVSATGNTFVAQDGDATFFTLDRGGNFLSRLRLQPETPNGKPVRVQQVQCSGDGKTILLRLRGDKLALLRAGS